MGGHSAYTEGRRRCRAFRDLRIALVVSALASMTVLSGSIGGGHHSASAAPQVAGDLRAWEEVMTAYEKLRALSGWRETVTGQGEGIATREVVPPESSRSLTKLSSGGFETITVGQDVRYRMNAPGVSGAWTCLTVPGRDLTDPSNAGGIVEIARGFDTTINGTRVRTYTYAWTPPVQAKAHVETGMVTIYVGVQTGLPRRFVAAFPSGSQTIDYYDYGAKITITLPPCG
jgi:hypothetical protein